MMSMKCEKCGGPIDATGRYCMQCFEPVDSPSKMIAEKKPLPMKAIFAGGGIILLIIIVSILLGMRTMPPDKVALEWLEACASANGLRAVRYTTDNFETSSGFERKTSYDKIDQYVTDRQETGLTFTVGTPKYDSKKRATKAMVLVTFHYGELTHSGTIFLCKKGRDWKIDKVVE